MVSGKASLINANHAGTVRDVSCKKQDFPSERGGFQGAEGVATYIGRSKVKHLLLLLCKTKIKTIPAHPGVRLKYKRL